jgi:hypothetical protein
MTADQMRQAPVVYMVRYWVAPDIEAELLRWIDEDHLADVAAQPGFTSGTRYTLNQPNEAGWNGFMNVYGVESEAALQAYFESDTYRRYRTEMQRFIDGLEIERLWGTPVTRD